MGIVAKNIRLTQRYTEILTVLVKYGMGDILHSLKIDERLPFISGLLPKAGDTPIAELNRWENIRMALEELGPTFIKLGQLISNRPDIAPMALIKELEKLQDTVSPFPYENAAEILKEELGKDIKDCFKGLSKKTVAAASISQVYRAKLLTGEDVAVKVQRPDIEKTVETDIEILHTLASLAENNIEEAKYLNPVGFINEFEEHIKQEMDFQREAHNIERFHSNFKNDERIYPLKHYPEFSTKRILTMGFIDGIKAGEIKNADPLAYDRKKIAENGALVVLKQIFIDGFFHADPHPGNIIIMPGNKICFIDFGMMGAISDTQKDNLSTLMLALMYRNSAIATNAILELVGRRAHPRASEIEFEVQKLIDRYLTLSLSDINIAELLLELISMLTNYRLKMPSNFSFMVKALITIEGVGLEIDPDFQIMPVMQKFSKTMLLNKLSPKNILMSSAIGILEFKKLLEQAPHDIREVIYKIKQGQIKIEFEHHNLGRLNEAIEGSSRRLVFGIALGSLIIGSSIMVHADIAPKWYGVPIIGLFGFVISGLMAAAILFSTAIQNFKNRKK